MEDQTKHQAPKGEVKPPKSPEPPVSGPLAQFEAWLYDMLVVKAPFQLPKNVKDWIVQYGPWIALIGGILAVLFVVPATFAALSLTGYTSAVLGAYGYYGASVAAITPVLYLSLAVLALQLVIMFVSIPMLLKRQRKGWLLFFYSDVIIIAYSLVSSFTYGFNFGTLLFGVLGAIIGFYFIFQIRSYYKR